MIVPGHASEDEQTRLWLRQRSMAQAMQNPTPIALAHRWQVFERIYQLVRPIPGGHYDASIARPSDDLLHDARSMGIRVQYAAEPSAVGRAIEVFWWDIRRDVSPHNLWKVHQMNDAVYTSAYFPMSHRHFLITTDWERHCRPGKVPLAVEITWHHGFSKESGLVRPWLPRALTTVAFLESLHVLSACTSTHRCHIHLNGIYWSRRWMHFTPGSYVHLEAFQIARPLDTESEDELPRPMAGPGSEGSSTWTSSSTSQVTIDELYLGDAFLTDFLVVFRPAGAFPRPLQLVQAIQSTDPNNLVVVMQHWNDLRYNLWSIKSIHPTYDADYPQSDDAHLYVLVAPCDLHGPLFQVGLNVVQTRTAFYRAVVFAPYVSREDILKTNQLETFCQSRLDSSNCRVYVNGLLLPPQTTRAVQHGDYIRTMIDVDVDEAIEEQIAAAFHVPSDSAGLTHLNDVSLGILAHGSVGQPQIAMQPPRPSQAPTTGAQHHVSIAEISQSTGPGDHADYWVFMAVLMYGAAMIMGRFLHQDKIRGVLKRKRHRLDRQPCNGRIIMTFTFVYMLIGADAIAINARVLTAASPLQHDLPPSTDGTFSATYVDGALKSLPFERPPDAGLPPPGNPLFGKELQDEYDLRCTYYLEQCRTNLTEVLVQRICFFIEGLALRKAMRAMSVTSSNHGKCVLRLEEWLPPVCTETVSPFVAQLDSLPQVQDHDTPFVAQTPAQTVHSPSVLSGDPDLDDCNSFSSVPSLNISGSDRALDDLLTPWDTTSPPNLENDFEDVLGSIAALPIVDADSLEELFVYTDGSHGDSSRDVSTTWAFCILGYIDGQLRVVDWFCDFISMDPLDSQWIGAIQDSIRCGEASALLFAALWILQANVAGTCTIFSDSLTTLSSALGKFGFGQADPLMMRLRALFQFVQQASPTTTLKHVKAHSGVVGNEFADRLAVKLREGMISSRPIPRHYAEWFHGNPPQIFIASFILDFSVRPQALPHFDGSSISLEQPKQPDEPPDWLRPDFVMEETTFTPACLQCCTYNVNTLKATGMVAFLRDQLRTKKIFLAGLQETRTSSSTTFDSDFIRLVAPSKQGLGGTELWISTSLPFGWHDQKPAFFGRDQLQVLFFESEILLATLDFGSFKLLCAVAHGPHRGHKTEYIQTWWNDFQLLCKKHRHVGPLLVFIDANAGVGPSPPHFGDLHSQTWDVAGQCMLTFCRDLHLCAPSTFVETHSGDSATWHSHKLNCTGSRNDYILVSLKISHHWGSTWVDRFLDSGHAPLCLVSYFLVSHAQSASKVPSTKF